MYETGIMSKAQSIAFADFVDKELGVDYEIDEAEDGEFYILFMDLELRSEYKALIDFEKSLDPPSR
jgi:hypothetical protein